MGVWWILRWFGFGVCVCFCLNVFLVDSQVVCSRLGVWNLDVCLDVF